MHKIVLGDCLEVLKTLESNSIDSLVTDPPAGIGFMGKEWDHNKGGRDHWIKWMSDVMRECHRVLKPGAHGLVWSLPRTSHWTAMALEDAGFEIRDCVSHLFGSGFPKSLNVSKAIDKAAGAERERVPIIDVSTGKAKNPDIGKGWKMTSKEYTTLSNKAITDAAKQWDGFGTALKPAVEMWWLIRKKPVIDDSWLKIVQCAEKNLSPSHAELNAVMGKLAQLNVTIKHVAEEIENLVQNGKAANGLDTMDMFASALKEADTDLSIAWSWNNTSGANLDVAKTCITLMELRQTIELKISNYCRFQSTLENIKPSEELIWLIRKPLSEKTVAENVLKWGTGGINVDGCRIEPSKDYGRSSARSDGITNKGDFFNGLVSNKEASEYASPLGRFPSNLVLSHTEFCTDEICDITCAIKMLDEQSGNMGRSSGGGMKDLSKSALFQGRATKNKTQSCGFGDSGGASRFFYCAKTSTSERNAGLEGMKNTHPTLKSQKLMRYFCRLVTPQKGIILDPFMGSGSTGLAAKTEGFEFIGIEKEPEYFEIARKRISP